MTVILALGSNIGDSIKNLRDAVRLLPLQNNLCSPIYKSPALLPPGAPDWWNAPYLNMVVAGYTDLSPHGLLQRIKCIEYSLGRVDKMFWGPRTIDIDIVLWNNTSLASSILTIPHKEMHTRDFVLVPTCDICPQFPHATINATIESILKEKRDITVVKAHNTLYW